MRKQEKIDLIMQGIENQEICRCYFTYDENYFYYFPNAVNNRFLLGQEEDDFLLDGYCIRKISQLKTVEIKNDLCNTLCKKIGLHQQIKMPQVDLSGWKSIFESLQALDTFVIIENEQSGAFAIGLIEKVFRNKLYFKSFDADGIWDEDGLEILYSQITTVRWNTRYTTVWEDHLRKETLS